MNSQWTQTRSSTAGGGFADKRSSFDRVRVQLLSGPIERKTPQVVHRYSIGTQISQEVRIRSPARKLGPNSVGWQERDVATWLANRLAVGDE